eukprot:CAMPEP_0201987230 /NCGR_PEP_ID=MMETSP0904-20121228/91688_1 /ASSEMBLY_ACC=CAM_ASM_000553 /TAXON_ID=420261 /ORGANISM="Thalassiosira antarctica, Strain CCMP982" /LENGTH=231 /DNA_ID=CAMNT_0048541333 /DNA_START=1004 /DNA_END=1699 /DNA_ORIENTATION=+
MATSNTMAPSSAGGRDCSNYCQMPWPLQATLLHHLLAAATAPTIVEHHGHFEYHGSIICWRSRLLQLLSNAMATSNTMAPSFSGGHNCSNYCRMPWPLQIPWLHYLLVAVTAPTIVKCHGHFEYHGSIICWRPRLLRPASNAMATLNNIAPSSAGGRNCKYHGSIICWRPLLLPPSSHVMANSNTMALDIICWRPQLLPPSLNVMATLNNIAPSSSGGRNYSNHCQKPWPL